MPGLVNQHNIMLDAHHRYRGCKKVGIPFRYKVESFDSKADEILRIVELNGNRRHMNKAQRALLVLRAKSALEKMSKGEYVPRRQGCQNSDTLRRIDRKLAKRAHTSRYTIRSVDQLQKDAQESPEMRLEKGYDRRYQRSVREVVVVLHTLSWRKTRSRTKLVCPRHAR